MTIDDVGGWPTVLSTLSSGGDLSPVETEAALATVLAGDATDAQLAAFIVALRQKGETVDELTGLVQAMRGAALGLELPDATIDIVGAGGSPARRQAAFNVSTMACFVAAGAGATVCKHGNRKASSTSGSFDLLEALGVAIELGADQLGHCLAEAGVAFAFARTFHPAMRFAGPVRAELGIPTVFNILGPLSHPGSPRRQVVGVADEAMADLMIRVLQSTGSVHAQLVTGDGAIDEYSVTGPTRVLELRDGEVSEQRIDPADLGFAPATAADLAGGDAEANAVLARRLFAGELLGPKRDMVVLNAAAGLVVAGQADTLASGVAAAGAAIDDGRAEQTLERLIAASND